MNGGSARKRTSAEYLAYAVDVAKIVEALDARSVSSVLVTQTLNTTTGMGRLTLNVLLSFAQFEREATGEDP
jgi:DNA invertase Pin-like site-specific DNA recombinase